MVRISFYFNDNEKSYYDGRETVDAIRDHITGFVMFKNFHSFDVIS